MGESEQRTAVVTGGNRGLGLETCRQLARRGLRVLLAARDGARGRAAAGELAAQGLDVAFHALDVSDPRSLERFAAEAPWGAAGLDVLVNNAGVSLDGFDAEVARRTLAVNFYGALHLTGRLLPALPRRRHAARRRRLQPGHRTSLQRRRREDLRMQHGRRATGPMRKWLVIAVGLFVALLALFGVFAAGGFQPPPPG